MLDEFLIRHSAPTLAGAEDRKPFLVSLGKHGGIKGNLAEVAAGFPGKGTGSYGYAFS
ncbi:hypothetical protein [Blautia argi]|uniref:hypothetical protein n=1 Tax=Blautia argi TaxID=1912897 RepID=UPI001FA8CFBF|nr:hypothetical protein [Blautia argi]